MIERSAAPPTPAVPRGVIENQGDSRVRQAGGNGREPHLLPGHDLPERWGWHRGELICPLSWLRAARR
jgi:hypothetical protein